MRKTTEPAPAHPFRVGQKVSWLSRERGKGRGRPIQYVRRKGVLTNVGTIACWVRPDGAIMSEGVRLDLRQLRHEDVFEALAAEGF